MLDGCSAASFCSACCASWSAQPTYHSSQAPFTPGVEFSAALDAAAVSRRGGAPPGTYFQRQLGNLVPDGLVRFPTCLLAIKASQLFSSTLRRLNWHCWLNFTRAVGPSSVHGVGLHTTTKLQRGTSLGKCVTWSVAGLLPRPKIERVGLHVNHSWRPNAILASRHSPNADASTGAIHTSSSASAMAMGGTGTGTGTGTPPVLELILLRDLEAGEEVTSNYLLSPVFIALPWPWPIWRY